MPEAAESSVTPIADRVQPALLVHLLELLGGEGALPQECADLIGLDPVLMLWALETRTPDAGQSALPGIEQALRGIDVQGLKTLLVRRALGWLAHPVNVGEAEQSWRRSLRCAFLCEALAREQGHPYPQEAYLAGLLHNLGPSPPAGWDLDQVLQEQDEALARRLAALPYETSAQLMT